jgi:hypothetical protein
MLRAGHNVETLAEAAGVTGKSVQRWVAGAVTPFSRTRFRVAALLGEDESYLWPQAVNHAALAGAELVATYPRRTDVPAHLWTDLLRAAQRSVDVLAFAGLFLAEEHSGWLPALAGKIGSEVRVRLLLGDPGGSWRPVTWSTRSAGALPGASRPCCPTTGSCRARWSFACTTPRCTTRSTGSMTRCWSTSTSTASWRPTRR